MTARTNTPALPPVILLGGEANALSVARDLGRLGVRVFALGEADSFVRFSRHCTWIDAPARGMAEQTWANYLLGDDASSLHGAVLLSCSDAGLQLIMRHREALEERYVLDASDADAQRLMLDKLDTYRAAHAAGVPTPTFWEIASAEQLAAVREHLVFPVLIKPRLSHLFERRFGRKHVIVDSLAALDAALAGCRSEHVDVLLMEWIPGGDDELASYFTYLDAKSRPTLHFTKRIIRRFPSGMGGACYHRIDWVPELIEPANRLFAAVGLRGLANVEFKLDRRDGTYKLIECNARFVASNCLVTAGGVNLAAFVYARLTGVPIGAPPATAPHPPLRLWDPARDFAAFRERSRLGELSFFAWIRSVARPFRTQYFAWTDPLPALARMTRPIWRRWLKKPTPAASDSRMAAAELADGRAVG